MSRTDTTTHNDWLRRVADYSSGGVGGVERAAVEEHLATCTECQEALAMYSRFSTLLRSPLRLGPPSINFDETPTIAGRTPMVTAPTQSFPQRRGMPPSRRRRAWAGFAAAVAAALIVAGFLALLGPRLGLFTSTGPKHQQTATTAPSATSATQPTATTSALPTATTPGIGAFICANPAGSTMDYAYIRGDYNLYIVKGCNQPQKVAILPGSIAGYANEFPIAWSPSNRYLMIGGPNTANVGRTYAVDTQTGALLTTNYSDGYGDNLRAGDTAHLFIGWLDDTTFLGASVPITAQNTNGEPVGPMTLLRVNVQSGQATAITKITWAASFAIRDNGQYLFYSGFQSAQEGGAWLHRVTLATGTDTKLVPLGIADSGPCQGTPVCPWTAPWDVTTDGAHIVYHNPGPTSTPSDIHIVPDSPLYYANADGSSATKLPSDLLALTLTTPILSPNGQYMAAADGSYDPQNPTSYTQIRIAPVGGGRVQRVSGQLIAWRADSQGMVMITYGSNGSANVSLYKPGTGVSQPLEANSSFYLWGN